MSTRTCLGGLPAAIIIASLNLVIVALGLALGAHAAGHGAFQARWGVASADFEHLPRTAICKALLDGVCEAALCTGCAENAGTFETHDARPGAGTLVDPLASVAAKLGAKVATTRRARTARPAIAGYAEGATLTERTFSPEPLRVAALRLVVGGGIAPPAVWDALAGAFAVPAQELALGVVHVLAVDTLLQHTILVTR